MFNLRRILEILSKKKLITDGECKDASLNNHCSEYLVVTMKNNHQVRKIIAAKKKHRQLEFGHLDTKKSPKVSTLKISPNSVINVNEFLPRSHYQLFKKTVKSLKSIGFQHVWRQFYCIYARFSMNNPVHMISDENQLLRIYDVYNPS